MVVQCANCQSKFRIADEKVTERGVRVRCTTCKNVFQVKRAASGPELQAAPQGVTGTTTEMQGLDPGLLAQVRAAAFARAPATRGPATVVAGAVPSAPPAVPLPARRPAAAQPAVNGARRLQADDLFGMAELTGDISAAPGSPLSTPQPPVAPLRLPPQRAAAARAAPPKAPPSARGAAPQRAPVASPAAPAASKRGPIQRATANVSFDDIDLEADAPAPEPARPVRPPAARPPPRFAPAGAPRERPAAAAAPGDRPALAATSGAHELDFDDDVPAAPPAAPPARPAEPHAHSLTPPPPPEDSGSGDDDGSNGVRIGAFKTTLRDPFEGVDLAGGDTGADSVELGSERKGAEKAAAVDEEARLREQTASQPAPPRSPGSEIVSSALTGLLGAALAIGVLLGAAVSEGGEMIREGLFSSGEVIATHLTSGLYDTASGSPIFFVRGRVENHSGRERGPVKVTAELVSAENGKERGNEALAGIEPSPEDVYSLRTVAETERLQRALMQNEADRRIPPGGSLPFFVVIDHPPADLQRHKLKVTLEVIDAWSAKPSAPK